MRLLGTHLLTALMRREEENNPKTGETLRAAIKTWTAEIEKAQWRNPAELRAQFHSADPVGNNRVVFNICGNKFRLVVKFNYGVPVARVKFAGTHKEYDAIDDIRKI